MATTSTLNVTTQLVGGQYQITASLAAGSLLPPNIFIYTNIGTGTLGPYFGVAALSELTRFQTFTGTPIPVFGNTYLLYDTVNVLLPVGTDPTLFIATLTAGVQSLSTSYQNAKISTQQIAIT